MDAAEEPQDTAPRVMQDDHYTLAQNKVFDGFSTTLLSRSLAEFKQFDRALRRGQPIEQRSTNL